MKLPQLCALSASVVLLTSCAAPKVWYQPGKTEAEIRKDWAEAQIASRRAELRIQKPIVIENDFATIIAHKDTVKAAREIAPLTMESKGYQLVPLKSVPANEAYLKP